MRASRIHKNLEVANRMEPYASRLRLRLKHFDVSDPKKKQRLANAHREMTKILVKKKVHPDEARRAVTRTLDIAADHLLEVLRRDQNLQGLSRSQRDLRRLIKQLEHLRLAISTLPPLAKSNSTKLSPSRIGRISTPRHSSGSFMRWRTR
jgi:phosphotransacetylase